METEATLNNDVVLLFNIIVIRGFINAFRDLIDIEQWALFTVGLEPINFLVNDSGGESFSTYEFLDLCKSNLSALLDENGKITKIRFSYAFHETSAIIHINNETLDRNAILLANIKKSLIRIKVYKKFARACTLLTREFSNVLNKLEQKGKEMNLSSKRFDDELQKMKCSATTFEGIVTKFNDRIAPNVTLAKNLKIILSNYSTYFLDLEIIFWRLHSGIYVN